MKTRLLPYICCCILSPHPYLDIVPKMISFRKDFCRRQRSDLFGHRVKLSPVTTSLTTQR